MKGKSIALVLLTLLVSAMLFLKSEAGCSCRPVGRGVAGVARATPTFGGYRVKSIVGHPNFWRKKALNWPPQLKIPTYGPEV